MRLTPRKAEVEEMNTVLNADHKDVDAASKEALKRAASLFGGREWWTVALIGGERAHLMGLYSSQKEAEKAAKTHGALAGSSVICVPIHTVDAMDAALQGQPMPGACECGHGKPLHNMNGSQYGGCGLSDCDCDKFREGKWPYPKFNNEGESDD